MRHHLRTTQWVAVPAALAALTIGFAGTAQAEPGQSGYSHASSARAQADPGMPDQAKASRGATTFAKPNHWQAQADPDGMTNGGVDQPGGTGGTIGYQDGNNGSGNDLDCEDDNRGQGVPGHCKDKLAEPKARQGFAARHRWQSTAAPDGRHGNAASYQAVRRHQSLPAPGQPAAEVLGISAVRPRTQPHLAMDGQVAGVSAQVQPMAALQPMAGVLPNTGTPGALLPLGAAGAALAAGGAGLLLRRRRVMS
jgi:LPXTG-motif cell wall-anchored protein